VADRAGLSDLNENNVRKRGQTNAIKFDVYKTYYICITERLTLLFAT